MMVKPRSRLSFPERNGNEDIEETRAHERPGRGSFLSNSRVPLGWCSLKTNKKKLKKLNGAWSWLFLPQINKQINTFYITSFSGYVKSPNMFSRDSNCSSSKWKPMLGDADRGQNGMLLECCPCSTNIRLTFCPTVNFKRIGGIDPGTLKKL